LARKSAPRPGFTRQVVTCDVIAITFSNSLVGCDFVRVTRWFEMSQHWNPFVTNLIRN
jgi:hypothetical protein